MARLESCLCFNLFVGTVVLGVYTMVIYLVAFAVELWWIIDFVSLPVPAYILCAGYFIIFFMSVIMIAGIIGQKTRCVLVWLFSILVFFLPEGGMVLYMSIIHWTLRNKYGLTELIFWVCRAVMNIVAGVVVQSQYSAWRDEKQLLRRLQTLSMSSVISDGMGKEHGMANGNIRSSESHSHLGAYENLGFTSVTDMRVTHQNGSSVQPAVNGRIQRSLSSASQLQVAKNNSLYGGSLPSNRHEVGDWHNQLQPSKTFSQTFSTISDQSEFDASTFSQGIFAFPVKSDSTLDQKAVDLQSYRPRSLMYLDEDDYLTRPPPSRAVSLGYINMHTGYSTQSLDRAKFLRMTGGQRRTTSLDALDMRLQPDIQLQKVAMRPFDYLNRPGSKNSEIDNFSDDAPNIGDVAL